LLWVLGCCVYEVDETLVRLLVQIHDCPTLLVIARTGLCEVKSTSSP
jgi:hypothetical protein